MSIVMFQRLSRLHYFSAVQCCTHIPSKKSLSTIPEKLQNIIHSPYQDIQLTATSIPQFVFENFGKFPNKIAVECGVTGRKYTFEELRKKSRNFGKALRKKFKLNKGDVISLLLPNIPEYPICVLGALEAGLVVSPINPNYKQGELEQRFLHSNTKLVVTLGELWPLTRSSLQILKTAIPTIVIKNMQIEGLPTGTINFEECVETEYDVKDLENIGIDDLAMLPYSSGTTGLPKGVELTNSNLLSNLTQLGNAEVTLTQATTEAHQDIVPGILPWFHIYGMTAILLTNLHNLAKLVTLSKFSTDVYIDILAKYKPHLLYIAPPIVLMMNNSSSIKKEYLQRLNVICSGGAPLGAMEEEKLQKKADREITMVQGYGLTESSCCVTILSPSKKRQLKIYGTVGDPVGSTSIKIRPVDNPLGEALGPNDRGEILVKGPQIFRGYLKNPQETKDSFMDGWYCTGDIGYYDDHRCFYVTDRVKELIKVSSFQVAPAELEEIIRDYAGVLDSAVIGIPHEKFGEVPRAYIVQDKDSNISVKKLEQYVASKVASFKQLKGGVVILDSIPKTPSGKILRKDLKLLYLNEKH